MQDIRVDRSTGQLIGDWLESANPSLRGVSGAEFFAHPEKLAGLIRDQTEHADRAFVVVSVYTLKANSNLTTEQAEELIGRIPRAAYNYFEDTGR
jgi:hypothetical protein